MIVWQLPEMSLLVLLVHFTILMRIIISDENHRLQILMRIIDFSRVYNDEIQLSQATGEGARIAAMGTLAGFSSSEAIARVCAALNNPAFQGNAPSVSVDVVNSVEPAITSGEVCADSANLARVTITIAYNKIMWSPSTLTKPAVMRCAG